MSRTRRAVPLYRKRNTRRRYNNTIYKRKYGRITYYNAGTQFHKFDQYIIDAYRKQGAVFVEEYDYLKLVHGIELAETAEMSDHFFQKECFKYHYTNRTSYRQRINAIRKEKQSHNREIRAKLKRELRNICYEEAEPEEATPDAEFI